MKTKSLFIFAMGAVILGLFSCAINTNATRSNSTINTQAEIKNWQELGGPDAKIVVLDIPKEVAENLLRKYYLGQDLKISSEAVVLRRESELIAAIQNTPYSIGAFSLAYAISHKLPVNHLSLNGVEPSLENIKNNKYPMIIPIGITIKKTPAKSVKEFVNYARSQSGKKN
ncbi:substrate-binding domain-containing protein [Fischerella thermalis]|uniref:substrate-binding domain-containing protein n=1 Tax=Fischerella thermalis TaxID=372787 RepID=UPI002155085D|nr:substrate-binding domain-containing protein [Fischerella thermalis]